MKKRNQGPVPVATKRGPPNRNGRAGVANRLATANSPAKAVSDSFLIASSIFENGDDNLSRLEEEFLEAARAGDYGRLEKLLQQRGEYCVDVNVRDEETGNTAVMFAAKRGHTKFWLVLASPAKYYIMTSVTSPNIGDDITLLSQLFAVREDTKLVELLVRHCADVTLRNYEGQTAVEMASPAIQQLVLQSVDKGGPHRNLLQAAWQGNVTVIQKILRDCQVDINCTNGDGLTPLLLVTRDLQLFEKMKEKITAPYSPLDVIALLLQHRADPCATDSEGKTAVHYAASSKANIAKELVQVLLDHTHCTDVQDRRCFMPIHCAAQSGSVDVVITLLDGGSQPNAKGFAGATPLHISALNGHEPVCGVLLDRGADVTIVDDSGLTAVDVAKSKKVKATLKQAWTEATEKKGTGQLNPVRAPSRSEQPGVKSILRRSKSFNIGNKTKRTGEVIFDSLQPSGSFDNIQKKSSLLSSADKARLAEEHMLRESLEHNVSPSPFSSTFRGSTKTNLLTTPRSPPRSPSRSPPSNRKLAPLKGASPRKPATNSNHATRREIKFGPGTKSYDGRGNIGGLKQPGSSSYTGLKKCPSDPTKFSGGAPISVMGLDGDEHHVQCWRSQGSFPSRKGHTRQGSDPFTSPTPNYDGSKTPEDFYLRGHSPSHISVVSMTEEWETASNNTGTYQYSSSSPTNRLGLQPPTPRTSGGAGVLTNSFEDLVVGVSPRGAGGQAKKQWESRGHKPQILTLERMQITNRQFSPAMDANLHNYPTSKKLLPPTPTYQEPPDTDRSTRTSKDNSPRSDDEAEEVGHVTRAKSVLRQGDFRLEDTQVGSSNDSGLPESSSSKSSSVASSTSTFSNGSPRTQESSPAKGSLAHSHSASALSSMDKSSSSATDRNSVPRTSLDGSKPIIGSSGVKGKRNTSFSNVRENTGFIKPDGKGPLSSSNKRSPGTQSGLRKSSDNNNPSTIVSDNSNRTSASNNRVVPRNSLSSGNRESGDNGKNSAAQSAKLRIIAKDNANNTQQNNSSFKSRLETNIEEEDTKGAINPMSNLNSSKTASNTSLDNSDISKNVPRSSNQSSKTKTHITNISHVTTAKSGENLPGNSSNVTGKTTVSHASRTVSAMANNNKTNQQQPKVLQLKAGASSSVTSTKDKKPGGAVIPSKNKDMKSPISERNKSLNSASANTEAKVIHVQEARSGSGIGTGSNSTLGNQSDSSSYSKTGHNNSLSRPGSRQSSVASNSNRPGSAKSRPEPSVCKKGPLPSNVNKSTPRQGSVSTSSHSGITRQSSVNSSSNSAVPKPTTVNSSSNSAVPKPTCVSSSSNNAPAIISNQNTSRQTSVNNTQSTSSSLMRQSSVNNARQSSRSNNNSAAMTKPVTATRSFNHQSSANTRQPPPQTVSNSRVKPAPGSYVSSVQQSKQTVTKDNNNTGENSSESKATHTTTMTFSLSSLQNQPADNNDSAARIQVFNTGDAPVAPPRKKRSSASSRSSSDSAENIVVDSNSMGAASRNTVVTELSANTLKHGMTPVTAMNMSTLQGVSNKTDESDKKSEPPGRPPLPVSKQISLDSSVSSHAAQNSSNHRRSSSNDVNTEHEGPIIWDPFESLNARRQKELAEMLAKERENLDKKPKSGKASLGRTNPTGKKSEVKGKQERQGSAGKAKRTRSKQATTGEESNKRRPKSSKKRRRGKKKENDEDKRLSSNVDNSNVALIGGIGWHIETGCDDRTDVQAVTIMDDSDVSDEDISITVVSDYKSDKYGNKDSLGSSNDKMQRELTIHVSGTLPGQISDESDDTDDDDDLYSNESDFEDIPEYAEVVHDDVQYVFGEGLSERTERLTQRDKNMRLDADDKEKVVHPETQKALKQFDNKVSDNDLDYMLGTKFPNIFKNTSPRLTNVTSQSHGNDGKVNEKKKTSLKRNNSLPSSQKHPTPKTIHKRHPSVGDNGDHEIDEMIDEILKSTPNPSMTLSIGSSRKKMDKNDANTPPTKSMTREEFEDALNQGGGLSFREVLNSSDQRERLKAGLKNNLGDDEIIKMVRNRSQAELQELMEWKNKVDDLNEQEQKQLNKLMNTVKNLGLKAPAIVNNNNNEIGEIQVTGLDDSPEVVDNNNVGPIPIGKPPAGPSAAKPSEKNLVMEKSPRFVRKKEAMQSVHVAESAHDKPNLGYPADSMSSFGSISIPSDSVRDDIDDRTEVVTSRMGRRSAASSREAASSVMSEGDMIQWKRGNVLGKGAYGIVWCGLVNSGELIAVKQIELNVQDMDRAEAEYEKIQQEVDLLKTLKHPNIVGYLGTSLEDSTVSIFMEFVPGGSIANLLARFGALEEEVFCNYTKQILEGVEYLHANNVIHRDIKGGNIMIMHNGVIKLIDFGCAKRLVLNVSTKITPQSKSRLLKSMRGTPYWMAPEVVKETGHGTKSDIWSIGCTVHEMASRKPPWADMPQMTAIFNIGNDSVPVPELPDKCSAESRDFARTCMTRNPNYRPSAPDLLKHPFILRRKKSRSNSVAVGADFR